MNKKVIVVLLTISIFFSLINLFTWFYFSTTYGTVTGNVFFSAVQGILSFFVESDSLIITIQSPQNTTYNFNIGDNYTIQLNVSASFNATNWRYNLYDLTHGEFVNNSISFTPNTTFNAVRFSNRIDVYANNSVGSQYGNASVSFFVSVPNSAPIIGNISEILVCEGTSLVFYPFNITDVDEDSLNLDISPKNPFFVSPAVIEEGNVVSLAGIFSGTLQKSHVGFHPETISANDGQYIDTRQTNITVIEINNAPSLSSIGAQTVWTQGQNSNFTYQLDVNDIESGNYNSGNLTFNLTFFTGTPFFNISSTGYMFVAPNNSQVGVYNLSVCVTDLELDDPSINISYCGQDGGAMNTCKNFSLTVTNENREPTIDSFTPTNTSFSSPGADTLNFGVTVSDLDGGIPDVFWLLNGNTIGHSIGDSSPTTSYSFGCGVSGPYNFTAVASDGLLNDSTSWIVTVTNSVCPPPTVASGGGGGGGGILGPICLEKWGCDDWSTCQDTQFSIGVGELDEISYVNVKSACAALGLGGAACGYQLRDCNDYNYCNRTKSVVIKPVEVQACHYTSNPSCFDGIKNCHDGACEFFTDCGGTCGACSTCSDRLQNQDETGIDCGGPCPSICEEEVPLLKIPAFRYVLILLIVLLVLVVTRRVMKIYLIKKRLAGHGKKYYS